MTVLVTGGAGFIGSTIVRQLLELGHSVRVYDNLETGHRANVPEGVELIQADVRDAEALAFAATGCEVLIHQAAMVSVPVSVDDPALCYEVNVVGTRNALEAARRAGARRVVLASSAAVYGNEPTLPKREAMPHASASPYAMSKWMNEVDAAYYAEYCGLETVCTRYFNVFGPRQRPDSPYSGVISIAADRLLAGEPFTVYGSGEQTRDFIFVEDVAAAVIEAATTPGLRHEIFNVGRGEATDLLTLVRLMGEALGVTPELRFAEARAGDVLHSVADVSRLDICLGFRARTPLATGLERTLEWMKREQGVRV